MTDHDNIPDSAEKPLVPYRVQMKFWLDVNREDERLIGLYLHRLKQTHKYTATIRDGIRLIQSLREGRADVLLELFPNIQDTINRHYLEAKFFKGRISGN